MNVVKASNEFVGLDENNIVSQLSCIECDEEQRKCLLKETRPFENRYVFVRFGEVTEQFRNITYYNVVFIKEFWDNSRYKHAPMTEAAARRFYEKN